MKTKDFIAEQKQRIDHGDTLPRVTKDCASVFATNDRIYSYGYHYPLLFTVTTPSGRSLWVCNDGGYSVTTARHISYCSPLADVCAPIGATNGRVIDYADVVDAITSEANRVAREMASKKRKDTQVYRGLVRDFEKLSSDLELLSL